MKCKSCTGEVPSKFTHAILVNICPLCGEVIMDSELQAALKDLKAAMGAVDSYSQEIFDWLKSNYNLYTSTDLEEKVQAAVNAVTEDFNKKFEGMKALKLPAKVEATKEVSVENVELDANGNQISGPTIQTSEQTNKFFKNAEANKIVDRQKNFKQIIKQIKEQGSPALLDESGKAGVITPDMASNMQSMDNEELAELRAAFGEDELQSGLDGDFDYEDEIPSVVLNMSKGANGINTKDLTKLQNLQNKSARAKSEMAKNGSVGFIRR